MDGGDLKAARLLYCSYTALSRLFTRFSPVCSIVHVVVLVVRTVVVEKLRTIQLFCEVGPALNYGFRHKNVGGKIFIKYPFFKGVILNENQNYSLCGVR